MKPDEAYRRLGLPPGANDIEIRAAYRRLVRGLHPDRSADPRAHQATAELNEAFRTLRGTGRASPEAAVAEPTPRPAASPPNSSPPPAVAILRPDRDSLAVAAPAADVLPWLVEGLQAVGDVSYLDADAGLIEAIVVESSGNHTSVVVSLQGRGDGTTEAFCSAERIAGSSEVDLSEIVDRVVDALARRAPPS